MQVEWSKVTLEEVQSYIRGMRFKSITGCEYSIWGYILRFLLSVPLDICPIIKIITGQRKWGMAGVIAVMILISICLIFECLTFFSALCKILPMYIDINRLRRALRFEATIKALTNTGETIEINGNTLSYGNGNNSLFGRVKDISEYENYIVIDNGAINFKVLDFIWRRILVNNLPKAK